MIIDCLVQLSVKVLDKMKNGMALWQKAREEVLLHSVASFHDNVVKTVLWCEGR